MSAHRTALLLAVTATTFFLGRSTGIASAPQQEMDAKAMEAGWDAMGQVGRMHQLLEPFVGTWQAKATFQMPDGELTSTGVMKTSWILDGKILEQRYHSDDMMGAPFDGLGLMTYSAGAECFQGLWCDSMTTHMDFNQSLQVSDDGKTFTGEGEQYMAPGMKMPYVDEIMIKSENEHVFKRSMKTPGGLEEAMRIVYTR